MDERLNYLLQLESESPEDSFILFALGKEHEKLGQYESALECYNRLVDRAPAYVGVYYHLGKLYELLGKHTDAAGVYARGIVISENLGDTHAALELKGAQLNLSYEH
jgi:tetratricopeptide (TPR) repeat protein